MAGGPKTDTDEEFLAMVRAAVDAGGRGVAIGRNVFQHENPTAMTRALTLIVHKGASVRMPWRLSSEKDKTVWIKADEGTWEENKPRITTGLDPAQIVLLLILMI